MELDQLHAVLGAGEVLSQVASDEGFAGTRRPEENHLTAVIKELHDVGQPIGWHIETLREVVQGLRWFLGDLIRWWLGEGAPPRPFSFFSGAAQPLVDL